MYLVVGDLHLTDRPQDAYRFGILEWIRQQRFKLGLKAVVILGDLTNSKDSHSSTLVNAFVDKITKIEPPIYIVMGNHDYIDPRNPFFRFLNSLDGIYFITKCTEIVDDRLAFIPHCRTQAEFDANCQEINQPDYLFLHQTFAGAIAETGAPLSGFSVAPIKSIAPRLGTYAGDVHKPQQAGPVTYVGSPYTIRFGDDFEPRTLLLDGKGGSKNLYFDCPRKWKLQVRSADAIVSNKTLLKGDQVKVTVELAREEVVDWKLHKKQILDVCKDLGLEVFGVELLINTNTPQKSKTVKLKTRTSIETLIEFSRRESLSNQVKQTGLAILEE